MISLTYNAHIAINNLSQKYSNNLIVELYSNYIHTYYFMSNSHKQYEEEDIEHFEVLYDLKVQIHDLISCLYDGYDVEEYDHEIIKRLIQNFLKDTKADEMVVYTFVCNLLSVCDVDVVEKLGVKIDGFNFTD